MKLITKEIDSKLTAAGDTGTKAASNTEQSSALSTRRYATNI